jgi:uncharacterized protein (TIGR03086 family)
VVAGVPQSQEKLGGPTPCPGWDLRALLNHVILWTAYSAERRAHGESVSEDLMNKDFTADPQFREDYQEHVTRAVKAWSEPGAWQGERAVMGNATPAADVGAMLVMELVLHGWDVASATGQEYRAGQALAEAVLGTVSEQAELFRQYQGFADPVELADDASAFHRALALSGRDPRGPKTG